MATTDKLFEEVLLEMVQKHIGARDLLKTSQLGVHARHNTTLQYMRLTEHVTLNSKNNMSMAALFLNIEKPFYIIRYPGFLHNLHKLIFLINLIKLISSILSNEKVIFSVEDEMSTPREIQAGVPQCSVLSPKLYSM
jgi:hypothetical protein